MLLFEPSQLQPSSVIERHHHARPYATIVLSGAYEEAGDAGRFRVEPGNALVHGAYSAHVDRISSRAAAVLDLPLPLGALASASRGRIADPDEVVRLSGKDRRDAVRYFLDAFESADAMPGEMPDLLAEALRDGDPPAIGEWAAAAALTREHVSRAFTRLYGVSPARYRGEARARSAWRMIVSGDASLAAVAADAGFADQAHMTRAIRSLTGFTPSGWRVWRQGSPSKRGSRDDVPAL